MRPPPLATTQAPPDLTHLTLSHPPGREKSVNESTSGLRSLVVNHLQERTRGVGVGGDPLLLETQAQRADGQI